MDIFTTVIQKISTPEARMILAFISSAFLTFYTIPVIVRIDRLKNLCDVPNGRGSHSHDTPTLGGIAIFSSFVVVALLSASMGPIRTGGVSSYSNASVELPFLIAGLTILFFIGIKDDIMVLAPDKKLAGQVLAMLILSVFGGIRISSFQGLFGINELPYVVSILFTLFVGVGIINSINLTDGIDGLAAAIVIVASAILGIWFYSSGEKDYAILAACVIGTLVTFFYFNVFGKTNKIFMGDTGSLILGFIITLFLIKFIELNKNMVSEYKIISSPVVAIGIIILPVFDTLRVLTTRILRKQSPFIADRRHLHHLLVDLGFTHFQTTTILTSLSAFFIILSFALKSLNPHFLLIILFALIGILTWVAIYMRRQKDKSNASEMISA